MQNRMGQDHRRAAVTNKQVIAIFIVGLLLLLVAFWAGLSVVKQDTGSGQPRIATQMQREASAARSTEPAAESGAQYIVFVRAFGTLTMAKQMENDLKQRKYLSAHVKSPDNQDPLYRVNIGPFAKSEADKVAHELSVEGIRGVLVLPWDAN